MTDPRKARRDARPRCKALCRNGAACSFPAGPKGLCHHHAGVVARGRAVVEKPVVAKPCGLCSGCDEERFVGWLARIEVGLPTDAGEGFAPLGRGEEEGAREVLAAEIRDDMARRHPFGVAVRLGAVIATLAACDANEDRDAIRDLADLIEDEQASQRLNGSGVTCAAWAKRADERKAAHESAEIDAANDAAIEPFRRALRERHPFSCTCGCQEKSK